MNNAILVHTNKIGKKPPTSVFADTIDSKLSPLTGVNICDCGPDEVYEVSILGGRKKGSTNDAKMKYEALVQEAITTAATLYLVQYQNAQWNDTIVTPGTYARIISAVEEDNNLKKDTIKLDTIKSRIKRNNITGFAAQRTSPLYEIEPLIVQYCIRLSEIGVPLTRHLVIALADSAIKGKIHYKRLYEYKKKLKLKLPEGEDDSLIGKRWYYGFLERTKIRLDVGKDVLKMLKDIPGAHINILRKCINVNINK